MNNNNGYSHLDEEDDYVPTTADPMENAAVYVQPTSSNEKGPVPTAVQYPTMQQQPLQYYYVVPQQAVGDVYNPQPQIYYPHLINQQIPTQNVVLPPLPTRTPQSDQTQPTQNVDTHPTHDPNEAYVSPLSSGLDPTLVLVCSFIMPGLGHLVIGQQSKAALYFVTHFLMSILTAALMFLFFTGVLIIPIQLIYLIMVMIDSYYVAERLKKGYAVMKGECWSRFTAAGVSLIEKKSPVFVYGVNEPLEWKQRNARIAAGTL